MAVDQDVVKISPKQVQITERATKTYVVEMKYLLKMKATYEKELERINDAISKATALGIT